jgi:hypothetical protein
MSKNDDEVLVRVEGVSFELRRGELRTLGQSEKEVSKKCLGATKVPDSGRRRHQCLGLIGHNGAGTQAAWQPLGPRQPGGCTGDCRKAARRVRRVGTSESTLPQAARRVRRRGKARINMTLLKMLNGLIKPDAGSITMRGRVGALIALGAGVPRLSALGSGRSPSLPINGSVLGLSKKSWL